HILIADFYGLGASDASFADAVAAQVDADLDRFKHQDLRNVQVHVPLEEIEFQRLRCFVDSHPQAAAVAKAWKADLVIWGQAYCNPKVELHQTVNVEQKVETGPIDAKEQSIVKAGNVQVEAPKPYAVCPSATLSRPEASFSKTEDR